MNRCFMLLGITVFGYCIQASTFTFDGRTYEQSSSEYYFSLPMRAPSDIGDFLYHFWDGTKKDYYYRTSGELIQARRTLSGTVRIPATANYQCNGVTDVFLTYIAYRAFEGCTNITKIVFDSTVATSIGACAFRDCTSLLSVHIPSSVTSIGTDVFSGCTNLSEVIFDCGPPQGLESAGIFDTGAYIAISNVSEYAWQPWCNSHARIRASNSDGYAFGKDSSFILRLSFPIDQSTIYYTTDGSDPTDKSTVYTGKIKIATKKTVKAVAYFRGLVFSKTEVLHFAPDTAVTPTISPADGTVFRSLSQHISLNCETPGVSIYYTLDGSEPTTNSLLYSSPFVISKTTTVKAKAFSDSLFDSNVASALLTCDYKALPAPVINAYKGDSLTNIVITQLAGRFAWIDITNAVEGSHIYYTIDGSEPTSASSVFSTRFRVQNTTTIKALAVHPEWLDSAVSSFTITKIDGIGDILGSPQLEFSSSGDADWLEDAETSFNGYKAFSSGPIGNLESSIFNTSVDGAGHIMFAWKISSEGDDVDHEFDHGEFRIDGVEVIDRIDGESGWITEDYYISGQGSHTVSWSYVKDSDDDTRYYDGGIMWVAKIVWVPDSDVMTTINTVADIPFTWLRERGLLESETPENAAKKNSPFNKTSSGRVLTVEDEYVQGSEPTDPDSTFVASIDMSAGLPVITWTPDLNEGGAKSERTYKVWGSTNLVNGGDWEWPTNALHRFFKVTVEMP